MWGLTEGQLRERGAGCSLSKGSPNVVVPGDADMGRRVSSLERGEEGGT